MYVQARAVSAFAVVLQCVDSRSFAMTLAGTCASHLGRSGRGFITDGHVLDRVKFLESSLHGDGAR